MKKLLYIFAIGLIAFSCSEENVEVANDEPVQLEVYKGIFSTNDSGVRATVEINLSRVASNITFPTATLTTSTGDIYEVAAQQGIEASQKLENILFESDKVSFRLSADLDGSNVIVSDVMFDNKEAEMMLSMHTDKAPVVPVSGTYTISGGTGGDTFSLMFTAGDGSGASTAITTMIMRGGVNYGTTTGNAQGMCVANFPFESCDITGTSAVLPGGNTISWAGSHLYQTFGGNCSEVNGAWTSTGGAQGTFSGDVGCGVVLVEEDFEDATVTYTSSIAEFTDGFEDYWIRTDGSDIAGVYNGPVGASYFAAQDIDGEGAASEQTLTWTGINVAGLNAVAFGAFFAEDQDGTNEDWDSTDFLIVEIQLDGGGYNTIFAIENDGSTFNSAPFIDTDFDGVGDGDEITDVFTLYGTTTPVLLSGAMTLDLRIRIDLNSGDEDIAIDNVRLQGL